MAVCTFPLWRNTNPSLWFFRALGNTEISSVFLRGVGDAHEKYGDLESTEAKGVKAHFRMDESGVLNLESVS